MLCEMEAVTGLHCKSLVRLLKGHGRLDTSEQCRRLNEIYELMWKYYNVFQPVLQLVQKS